MDTQQQWETDRRLVLTCEGKVGLQDREEFPDQLARILEGRERPEVILDFEHVEFVDSAGIGALLKLARRVNDQGGRLVIASVPPSLARLFDTVGLGKMIGLFDDLGAARAHLDRGD